MSPSDFRDEPPQSKRRGGLLVWALGGTFGLLLFIALVVVTMGQILPVLIMAAAIAGFAGFHYLVWGWWLGGRIRDQVDKEEVDEGGPDSSSRR
jgi:hypothetical protein